ncbi:hypothetical protein LUZ60_012505 [Juncus effusus]|nr:hypothetical protein LUZ60_012505 [Juncus effusus]
MRCYLTTPLQQTPLALFSEFFRTLKTFSFFSLPSSSVSFSFINASLQTFKLHPNSKPSKNTQKVPNFGSLMKLLFYPLFLSLLPFSLSICDRALISLAFRTVSGFKPLSHEHPCHNIQNITFPSQNLTGTVSWAVLANLSSLTHIDLSNNSLQGSIPTHFWSIQTLEYINLSRNRLGGALRFGPARSGTSSLKHLVLSQNRFTSGVGISNVNYIQVLDLSRNKISFVPVGLKKLTKLKHLDLSFNSMHGNFPQDLPPLTELSILNISYNNFTGQVDSKNLKKFGKSAFTRAGKITFLSPSSSNGTEQNPNHHKRTILLAIVVPTTAIIILFTCLCTICTIRKQRMRKKELKEANEVAKDIILSEEKETGWISEAKWTAPVIMLEKPLMKLTFADLAMAASGFGAESQLNGSGLIGPAYRAVLSEDLNVVVRVVESARDMTEEEAVSVFRELGRLRHDNLLPLLGYCISGKEKLLIYEYMERGDLHRWLHELPAGRPHTDDSPDEMWECARDWATRHRISLGIARGLAFLHQGWAGSGRPVTHGHLVPSNILLGDDLEPHITDFGVSNHVVTPERNVYQFGLIVFELMTCHVGWDEVLVNRVRSLVKEGRGLDLLDCRLLPDGVGIDWQRQMMECLRVGYLCTAEAPEKRPTMQQVVGLIKDIRPTSAATSSTTS